MDYISSELQPCQHSHTFWPGAELSYIERAVSYPTFSQYIARPRNPTEVGGWRIKNVPLLPALYFPPKKIKKAQDASRETKTSQLAWLAQPQTHCLYQLKYSYIMLVDEISLETWPEFCWND